MDEATIISRVQTLYPDAAIDINGEDCSFEVFIISQGLEGKNMLQRQQSILSLFNEELTSGKLHALSIIARTPDEHAAQNSAGLVQLKL